MTPEFVPTTLCSAGLSYFHIYPNGDVYRCLADYNARRAPMFNVARDGWQSHTSPTRCDHARCVNACDLDWTTKWRVDESERLLETVNGQRAGIEEDISRLLCTQSLEAPQRRMAYFVWSPTQVCNYTCAYCGCAAGEKPIRSEFPSSHPELSVDEWMDVWSDILDRFDYGVLSITGGEPLLSEATIPVLRSVSRKFACYITSNLSRNVLELTRGVVAPGGPGEVEGLGHVPMGLSGINASLHPTSKGFNWEIFKGSVLLLRNAGFLISVNYVGYPLQLYLAPEYQAWCEQHDIPFTLLSWQGVDNDGTIARYTPPERTFFEEIAPPHRKQANELVLVDCRYEVHLDDPAPRALMSDVVALTGRLVNRSSSTWEIGDAPDQWAVAGYVTRIGRRKTWLRELRASSPGARVPPGDELAFTLPIDTRGLPAGTYEIAIDLLMGRRNWMALQGAVPGTATLRLDAVAHEIAVEADALTVPAEGTAVVRGILRNTGRSSWPEGTGDPPLRLGARLYRSSEEGSVVREFRAPLERAPRPHDAVPFHLVLDPRGLQRGDYELSLDVVKEHQFWLAEKGTTPKIIPVVIA